MRRSFWPVTLGGAAAAALAAVSADSDAAPLSLALALVALAAWGAVLVLRRVGRRVVGVLGVLASAGGAVSGIVEATGAWGCWLALVVSAVLFVIAVRNAPGWPEMSQRYDARGAETSKTPADPWKAIDEGHDPTV